MENSLSDEELLFLSNLMHIKKEGQFKNIWNKKNVDNKSSIGEMLENIDTDKLKDSDITYDGEISGYEWAAMIEKIKDNPQICNLKLVDMDIDDKKALSVCLHNDETGETYVVFRGTSAGEWPDNFEGGYKADTEQQRRALAFLRGDSGFSSPKLYRTCEMNGCSYAIRLKQNSSLMALASDKDKDLYNATKEDQISYAVTYGEFLYQAGSWDYPRRVVFKIEKPYGQLTHMYTFIVTNMDMEPYQVIQYYCGRGKMENFIKEGKSGFDFAAVSSHSKVVNANRMRLHMLAYNLFNWFRRLVLPANMRKQQVDTIRIKLIKIAARAVRSARYITFKLCSSCPYKKEFYRTLENIQQLTVQLE